MSDENDFDDDISYSDEDELAERNASFFGGGRNGVVDERSFSPPAEDGSDQDFDEDLFCTVCNESSGPESGDVIHCEYEDCEKMYHLDCVGLRAHPIGEWWCPRHLAPVRQQRSRDSMHSAVSDREASLERRVTTLNHEKYLLKTENEHSSLPYALQDTDMQSPAVPPRMGESLSPVRGASAPSTKKKPKVNAKSVPRNGYQATIYWDNYPDIPPRPNNVEHIHERSVSALFHAVILRIKGAERQRGKSLANLKVRHVKDFGPDHDDSKLVVSADRLHHLHDLATIVLDALELPRTLVMLTVHSPDGTTQTIAGGEPARPGNGKVAKKASAPKSASASTGAAMESPILRPFSPSTPTPEVRDPDQQPRKRRKQGKEDDTEAVGERRGDVHAHAPAPASKSRLSNSAYSHTNVLSTSATLAPPVISPRSTYSQSPPAQMLLPARHSSGRSHQREVERLAPSPSPERGFDPPYRPPEDGKKKRKSTKGASRRSEGEVLPKFDELCYLCSEGVDLIGCEYQGCANFFHRDCLGLASSRATESCICTDHVSDRSSYHPPQLAPPQPHHMPQPLAPRTMSSLSMSMPIPMDERSISPPASGFSSSSRKSVRPPSPLQSPLNRDRDDDEEEATGPNNKKMRLGKVFVSYEAHLHWKYSSHSKSRSDEVIQSRSTTDLCNKFFGTLFEHEMQRGKDIFDCGKMPHVKEIQSEDDRLNGREGVIRNSRNGRMYAIYMDRKSHLYDLYRGPNGGMLKQMGFDPHIVTVYGVKASGQRELIIPPECGGDEPPPPPPPLPPSAPPPAAQSRQKSSTSTPSNPNPPASSASPSPSTSSSAAPQAHRHFNLAPAALHRDYSSDAPSPAEEQMHPPPPPPSSFSSSSKRSDHRREEHVQGREEATPTPTPTPMPKRKSSSKKAASASTESLPAAAAAYEMDSIPFKDTSASASASASSALPLPSASAADERRTRTSSGGAQSQATGRTKSSSSHKPTPPPPPPPPRPSSEQADDDDDYCCLCGDGSDLTRCEYPDCFKTYHLKCLEIPTYPPPPRPWHCPDHDDDLPRFSSLPQPSIAASLYHRPSRSCSGSGPMGLRRMSETSSSDEEYPSSTEPPSVLPQKAGNSVSSTRAFHSYEARVHWKYYPYSEVKDTEVLSARNVNQVFTAVLDSIRTKELECRWIDILLAKPKLSHVRELEHCNIKLTGREGVITAKSNKKFAVLADRVQHLFALHRGMNGGILRYLGLPPEMVDVYGVRDDGVHELLSSASFEGNTAAPPMRPSAPVSAPAPPISVIPSSSSRRKTQETTNSDRGSPPPSNTSNGHFSSQEGVCEMCKTSGCPGKPVVSCAHPYCTRRIHPSCAAETLPASSSSSSSDVFCSMHADEMDRGVPPKYIGRSSPPSLSAAAEGWRDVSELRAMPHQQQFKDESHSQDWRTPSSRGSAPIHANLSVETDEQLFARKRGQSWASSPIAASY